MKKIEAIDLMRRACRRDRLSYRTEESYCGAVGRFFEWCAENREGNNDERVSAFLSAHAERWSASSQNLHLNALVSFFAKAINKPLGKLPEWVSAKRPNRLPDWLTDTEVRAVLSHLLGEFHDMAALAYGSGLRLHELVSLRVKDLDFERKIVTVRGGKGDRDRVTFLPLACADDLQSQLRESRLVWERDRRNGLPGVYLPDTLENKYPNAGAEWAWQWLWPSRETSVDPRGGVRRRHHIHETAFQKAVKAAGAAAGLSKRVHPHLLRHSFACEYILQGGAIHELQALLGHASLLTTQVYLHCVSPATGGMRSPIDRDATSKVIHFQNSLDACPKIALNRGAE